MTTKRTEEFKVNGEDLLKKVKEIIKEGNVRRISIKNKEGKTIVELPDLMSRRQSEKDKG